MSGPTTAVVIVAAGAGLRVGGELPKQYQMLAGTGSDDHHGCCRTGHSLSQRRLSGAGVTVRRGPGNTPNVSAGLLTKRQVPGG